MKYELKKEELYKVEYNRFKRRDTINLFNELDERFNIISSSFA